MAKAKKKKKSAKGKRITKGRKPKAKVDDLEVTPIQLAKRLAGAFMTKYNLLLRDKVSGKCGEANSFLREEHELLFGHKGRNEPIPIIKARVCYELMARGYKEHGVENLLPKGFDQNWKAALAGNLQDFTPDVRELLRLTMMKDSDEPEISKIKKDKDPKIKKPGKDKDPKIKKPRKESAQGYIAEILWGNSKTKYTDDQLQRMVLKKFKDAPPAYQKVSMIRLIRSRLNVGFIKKYGKPKMEIKEY